MKKMGKETRRLLYSLLAICLAAAAGFAVLLSYMAKDFQKTIVQHDCETAGYLINHPDVRLASAFTKGKTDSDLESGRQLLQAAGYHEETIPSLIPAVAAYRKRTAALFGGMLFSIFLSAFLTVLIYIQKQKRAIAKADAIITRFLEGDTDQRISSEETGDWYSLFYRINELAARESKEILLSGSSGAFVCCDALWISEALGNVVKNALEHTGRGGKIIIRWERTPLLTSITVEDNGKGIPPVDIHNIFKRFYRSRFSQDTQGIGLGLPLAKAIMEAHQGTISVTSRVGQGSRFTRRFFHREGTDND